MIKLNNVRNELKNNDIVFSIAGCISKEMLEIVVENLKVKMKDMTGLESQIRYSIVVMVEMMQNMLNYAKYFNDVDAKKYGIVMLARDGETLIAYSSNLIDNGTTEKIGRRIDWINSLDKETLKEEFRKARRQPIEKNAKGAGLGLMEIAKVSSQPIKYHFEKYDEEFDYFNLQIHIF